MPDGSLGPGPIIGNGVDVGANVVILGNVKIHSCATIGAGSVVVHDVPANAVVVGNPARVIRFNPSTFDTPSDCHNVDQSTNGSFPR
jgi:putative colanic acid biosynthesis acetyltransferase WcaB